MLITAGDEAQELYETFQFAAAVEAVEAAEGRAAVLAVAQEDPLNFEIVKEKFRLFCTPRVNEIYERYVFRIRMQREEEPFEQFITDLKTKANTCNFGALKDSLIRDQVVVGIRDTKLKEKLLRDEHLTLERAITTCLASEVAKQQMKVLQGDDREPANVSEIRSRKNRRKPAKEKYQPDKQQQRKCGRCGKTHAFKKCPAWGQTCSKCGVKNHYSGQCRSKEDKVQSVEATHHYEGSDNEEEFFCTVVESNKARQCEWIVTLDVCGSETALKVDSGAQVNILNWSDYFKMKNKPLIEAKTMTLRAYNQEIIPTAGICHTSVVSKDKQYGVDFVVVPDKNRQSILGANDAERLGLITRADDVKKVYTVACKDSLSMEKLVKQHGD